MSIHPNLNINMATASGVSLIRIKLDSDNGIIQIGATSAREFAKILNLMADEIDRQNNAEQRKNFEPC